MSAKQGVGSMNDLKYLIHKHLIICSKLDCPMNRGQRCICYPCIESIESQQLRTVSDPRPSRADEPREAKSETPVPASSGREKGEKEK